MTDKGRENMDTKFQDYLVEKGIISQTTCVDTPQQNGNGERKNMHLLEVARSLVFTMRVSNYLWEVLY